MDTEFEPFTTLGINEDGINVGIQVGNRLGLHDGTELGNLEGNLV